MSGGGLHFFPTRQLVNSKNQREYKVALSRRTPKWKYSGLCFKRNETGRTWNYGVMWHIILYFSIGQFFPMECLKRFYSCQPNDVLVTHAHLDSITRCRTTCYFENFSWLSIVSATSSFLKNHEEWIWSELIVRKDTRTHQVSALIFTQLNFELHGLQSDKTLCLCIVILHHDLAQRCV